MFITPHRIGLLAAGALVLAACVSDDPGPAADTSAPTETEAAPADDVATTDAAVHVGNITALQHDGGKLESVTLDSGETVEVATLLFTPPEEPTPLVTDLVDTLGLGLDEHGYVAVDETQRTNVDRVWAAGDVQGWMGGIESANAGGMAAAMIIHDWYPTDTAAA